jgi:5-methylcytosine-specific restriction endonuclease McrA
MTGTVVRIGAGSEEGAQPSRRERAAERALVLNVTYEPVSIVSQRRALVLVLSEKVELLHGTGRVVHSAERQFDLPSVVKLRYHVRVPYRRRAPLTRRAVFARDGHRCVYCSRPAECIDHVHPRSRGGEHAWENVVAACRSCNLHKGDKELAATSLRLAGPPVAPPALSWVALAVPRVPPDWAQYLPGDVPIPA